MSADLALKILNSKLNRINFSIDGLDKNAYEKIRRGLSFEEVLGNVIAFIMLRNKLNAPTAVRISVIKNQFYLKDMQKIIAFWEKILDKSRGDSVKIDDLSLGVADKSRDLRDIDYERNALFEKADKTPCYAIFNTLVIKADGQVALCCADQCRNVSLGNLNRQSIAEIWQGSKELKRIRSVHIKCGRAGIGFCKGCLTWV